ncbi:hypothetical protein [Halovivax sp.]|uniref:hypothetical protein n=1 Tax=Halovivax sp. TaxID=1935978 RepID=UPI0025C3B25F|nr:hypothetical protein [Halovivax sp.]
MLVEPSLTVCALALGVTAGLLAHEGCHAAVLRAGGIDYAVTFFPGSDGRPLGRLASCPWAVVRPNPTGREPAWLLRAAALAPLSLSVPVFALVAAGHPPTGDAPIGAALALGWLACAIPSPQDFSVAFYAHQVLDAVDDAVAGDAGGTVAGPAAD